MNASTTHTTTSDKVAKFVLAAIVAIILMNAYFLLTTSTPQEGDQLVLLAWFEGGVTVSVLGWDRNHFETITTDQLVREWTISSGNIRSLQSQGHNMPYQYFGSSSNFTLDTTHRPGTFGNFTSPIAWQTEYPMSAASLLTIPTPILPSSLIWEEAFTTTQVVVHYFEEYEGSTTVYLIDQWEPTADELWLNEAALQYSWREGLSTSDDPRWSPRDDCRNLGFYEQDHGLPPTIYEKVDDICAGSYAWFR